MTQRTARRAALGLVTVMAAGAMLAGCSAGPATDDGKVELTLRAWANADEAEMYQKDLDAFTATHPDVSVTIDYTDVGTYRDKINTEFAAGDPPDVMFMVGQWMGEYVSRDALLNLSDYEGKGLDLSADNQAILASGTIDDTLYGVPTGSTAIGLILNTAVVEEAGVALPDDTTWTWDDFAEFTAEISAATGDETYGTSFDTSWMPTFSTFVRSRGEDVYSPDGKLSVSEATVEDFFETTYALQTNGGALPAKNIDTTGAQSPEQSPIATGKAASAIIPTNLFSAYNDGAGGTLTILRLPGDSTGERLGMAVTPTLLWVAAAQSEHPQEAAELIDFLTNDPASFESRGTYLGVPINNDVATALAGSADESSKTFIDFVAGLQAEDRDPFYLEPAGAGAVQDALTSIDTEVQFGRITPADAAERFMTEAESALEQATTS